MIGPYTGVLRRLTWLFPLLLGGLAFGQNGALRVTEPPPSKNPTVFTSEPAMPLKGTLSWTGGDMRVLWQSNRGFSDLAAVTLAEDGRTVLWNSRTPVPLRPGINHVRIRALGQPGAATFVNIYYSPRTPPPLPPLRTTTLRGKQIAYEAIGGLAVYQGDIVLGKSADVAAGRFSGRFAAISRPGPRPQSATIAPNLLSSTGLWPLVNGVVRVPYTIANTSGDVTNINAAITESNTQLAGVVQWVPATASDVNLVNFDFNTSDQSGSCEAIVGMEGGGAQSIGGSGACTTGTILHEMGHALGLFHEQSRIDRDSYVHYMEQNIDKPQHGNFDLVDPGVDSGLYNYASIMEYGPFSFNRDGLSPTLETIPAGMPLGTDMPQYTTGDLDGIERLYAHVPAVITVDTNPTGLQVVVDGTTCTAPCVFSNWALGSQHTLDVPLDSHNQTLQTLSRQNYIFGRWNAGAANQTPVTITNSAGDGTLPRPSTSPAITNYLASFIPVHPYNPGVYPPGSGTISSSPPASTLIIDGVSTKYYVDRQLITLTVTPGSGYNFYQWDNLTAYNFYSNPYVFYITTNFDYYNLETTYPTEAVMVNDPVTTIAGASPDIGPAGIFQGFAIGAVQNSNGGSAATYYYTPENFDATNDGAGFAAGASLTLCGSALNGSACPATPVAQSPATLNISYLFNNWSGAASGNTDSVTVTVPPSGQRTYTANYTPSFRTIVEPSLNCQDGSGNTLLSVTATPAGTDSIGQYGDLDAFFTAGTVNFTANPGTTSGLRFAGWSQDFSGTGNPLAFPLAGQEIATANFNIPGAAPLTITGISPATPTVTNTAVSLTVNGTGFATGSSLYTYFLQPNGHYSYRSNAPGSSTQLTMQLCGATGYCPDVVAGNAGDLATAGYYQIAVLNAVPSNCNPSTTFTFPVANSAGPPQLTITKSHTGNFGPGQQNAQYTVLVTNSGTGATSVPVTVTENVPPGETLVSMSGTNWTCPGDGTCTRSDSLSPGLSYPAIAVTVDVAANATSPQVNSVTVSGGGASSATATDSTTIGSEVSVPDVVGFSEGMAVIDIDNAGLAVGTVTTMSSNTVLPGFVISESPAAGTLVNTGSPVSLVVSTGPPSLQSIAVTPANPSVAKGLTEQFTATGTYSDSSTRNLTNSVTWASGTTATATVTGGGLATAVALGTSTISATSGAVAGSTVLTVTPATVQSIAVTPANPSIAKGLTEQFTATGTYSDGSVQNLTASVTWASGTTGTATITSGGLATGAGVGTSTIGATSGSVAGSTVLTVTAATLQSIAVTPASPSIAKGLTQQFTATGTYTDSSTKNVTASVTWASGTTATATIASGGLATAAAMGTSTIKATLGSVVGSTLLTVTAATLQSIAVTPANPSIAKGLTEQFTATGTYSDSSTQNLTSQVTWASGTTATATIGTGGLATGAGVGTSTISATSGSVVGSTVLTVTAAPLQSIAVTPANPSIAKGLTQQFTATGTYSDSSTKNVTASVTWASGTTATATIATGGLATGVAMGTSTISATSGSVVGSTVLTVTAATLRSIVVTPSNPSVAKGLTVQFTASGIYSDGTVQNVTASVTWSSGTAATITSGGLATGVSLGTSTISATSGTVVGSTVLTVTAATLQSIAVTPANPTITRGLTQQFTATGTYSDGSTQNLTSSVTWASGTTATATIGAGGLATAVAVGTSTIGATFGAVVGSTVLTVTAATLQSIAVTPANPSIVKGLSQQFTATGTYSDSTTQNLTSQVTWASGTTATATIASGGLATGAGVGTSTINATSGSVVGSTVLTVTAATLQSIAVTPANPSIGIGLTEQFTATGTYSDSSTKNLTASVTWASGTMANATITSGGLATAVAVGTSTIGATSGSIVGSTVLTVTAATLQSIAVTPANPSIAKGLTEQFTATGTYSDGSTLNLTGSVTWSSGTTATATIVSGGLATGAGVGTSTIGATSGSVVGSTVLTVTAATLQSIAVTPVNPSIAKGLTKQFTATGTYSDGSTQNLTSQVTWASLKTATATIVAGGLATAVATGTSTINATSGPVVGSTVLTVTAATLQSIAVTPANPAIAKGLTEQFTATGTYSDGSTKNLTASATWASGTTGTATITTGGLATGVAVGTSTIGATSGSVVGSTLLTVAAVSNCAVTQDGIASVADVQRMIDEALGVMPAAHDLNSDGAVNAIDVQIVIEAALGLGCTVR